MFGPRELDLRNIYNPNLEDIKESAERTYGEANSFYRKEELYLKDIVRRLMSGELSSEKDIYDECHAIASDLAECCEMYLKALYIYEHNNSGEEITTLWKNLKNSTDERDAKGNLIYKNMSGEITFVKYDAQGNPIRDSEGKIVYFDKEGNTYNENNRGSKIKRNGHQLDRLIEMLSPESSLLLETRMLTIPMEYTEKNHSISILDVLLEKGILQRENQISSEQYIGWVEQHKKTFEEARYSGQKKYNVNLEFLYHLTIQIKAVAQYRMDPKNNQKFTLTDNDLAQLPVEMKQIASSHLHLMSEDLIKLIVSSKEIKKKIIMLFSNQYMFSTKNVSQIDFYNMIKLMDTQEIIYILNLYYIMQNYEKLQAIFLKETTKKEITKLFEIARVFKAFGVKPNNIMGLLIQIKEILGESIIIGNESIEKLFKVLGSKNEYLNIYLYDPLKSFYNYYINDDIKLKKF